MTGNLSSPRVRLRAVDPMAAHDRLPDDLRRWASLAALPWSASSLLRIWQRALRETCCPDAALARLSRAEARTLAREAAHVWGKGYPEISSDTAPRFPLRLTRQWSTGPASIRRPQPYRSPSRVCR